MASLETKIAKVVSGSLAAALDGIREGAVEAGLTGQAAGTLARQSLLGTMALLEDPTQSPSALKDRVASPGGTTIAGLAVLEDAGVRGAFMRAVETGALGGEGCAK